MSIEQLTGGNIEPRGLEEEMRSSYLDYAMSVIVGRALPDVRDGLKPVHRRVLFSMHEAGLQPNRPFRKSSRVVGDVMGQFHPHGDAAIYDTLVRLGQDFAMRYPLVEPQGNFGSIDNDPPAAMRYCVTGDTRVATPAGTVRIDSIVPDAEPESDNELDLEVLDRLGRPVHASKLFHSGGHPTLRLRTREGHELTGTHNHPVLCIVPVAGVPMLLWKLLEELRPGDRVAMARMPRDGDEALGERDYEKGELKVVISNRRDARLFAERVGFLGAKQRKLERALVEIPETSRALSEEVRGVVEPLVSGDYYYATVYAVEDAGVRPVYSLKVDTEDHSFLTNGFVSHNTEARLARLATEMLRDIDADTVEFGPTYDESRQEPLVLPSRFPNLLVNGAAGIAVGMATNIPPHNLGEATDAVMAYIDDPQIDLAGLMKHIKGPDFPTGGIIVGHGGIREAYETGRGRVVVRGRAHIEPMERGKERIIVTEMPYQVAKGDGRGDGSGLIRKIAEQVQNGRIKEISDLRDESDRSGIRLVVELKRDAIPKVALNKLYKHTPLQTTFGVNMVALVDGVPRTLGLLPIVKNYVDHQRDVIVRRTKHELGEREARLHIIEGLLVAIADIDAVIELIRSSSDPDAARDGLMERFELSRIQAQAILDMRLARLTALEADKVKQEHADTLERIKELREILGDESRVMALVKEELLEIKERYGDDRRTQITHSEDEIDVEDLIADEQMVISITHSGYIKRLPLSTYRQQRRGGVGVMGMDMKDEDYIEHLFVCSSHDFLLFFTNRGKVYRQKVYELPEAQRTAKGRALVNVLPLRDGERVQAVQATRQFNEGRYLVFATRKGMIKKTEFGAYNTPIKADGIIAIKIRDDDELVAVRRTGGEDDIIMVSRSGQAARFNEDQVRPMGRDTAGVRGMNVDRDDNRVLAMDVVRPDTELLVVTENGYGKRTAIEEYPVKGRGTMGVKTVGLTEKKGGVAGALIVREHHDLVFISQNGMVQRTSARGISKQGRPAQGVRVMNLREDDQVSAVALVMETSTDTSAEVQEGL
ncbi:MAG: DNA gyrase subunit A, partial [Thermoleophilaceae bacterium]